MQIRAPQEYMTQCFQGCLSPGEGTWVSLPGVSSLLIYTPGKKALGKALTILHDEIPLANFFCDLVINKVWKQENSPGYCILPLLSSAYWACTRHRACAQCQGAKKTLETKGGYAKSWGAGTEYWLPELGIFYEQVKMRAQLIKRLKGV